MRSHQLPEDGENDILSLVIWNRHQILNRIISYRLFLLCFIFSHKTIHGIYFEKLLIVNRFLKGVINIRPALPRYVTVWNLSKICQCIKIQPALALVTLKQCLIGLKYCCVLPQRVDTKLLNVFIWIPQKWLMLRKFCWVLNN